MWSTYKVQTKDIRTKRAATWKTAIEVEQLPDLSLLPLSNNSSIKHGETGLGCTRRVELPKFYDAQRRVNPRRREFLRLGG